MHSTCPRHTLQARTMTRCPWPRFHGPLTLSWFYVESSIKVCFSVCFSVAVMAASVQPCPLRTLQARTKNRWPWPRFRTPLTLSWFYVESSIPVRFFVAQIAASVQTLHSNCPQHSLQVYTMPRCPWPKVHSPLTLSYSYVKSSIKVCFSVAVIAASVLPRVVIVLDILFKHALWPGVLGPFPLS